jgi:hypothetical protein
VKELSFWLCAALVAVAGCDKNTEPEARSEKPASTSASTPAAPTVPSKAGAAPEIGVSWNAPPEFEVVPPTSNMRKAGYRVPAAPGDKEPADLGVFYFGPGQGGSIDDNMSRWVKQFENAKSSEKRSDRTVNGLTQHLVETEGTYKSGMPGGPTEAKKTWALIGAIVESPNGNHFFKLVGPKATVEKARKPFMSMLDSIKAK